jgi:hypothetical protein
MTLYCYSCAKTHYKAEGPDDIPEGVPLAQGKCESPLCKHPEAEGIVILVLSPT